MEDGKKIGAMPCFYRVTNSEGLSNKIRELQGFIKIENQMKMSLFNL
jgi:hypothetical protein